MATMFPVDEDFAIKEFILDRISVQRNFAIGGCALQSLTIDKYKDVLMNQIMYSVRAMIPAEDVKESTYTVTVKYPDGWWNAFKDQYFTETLLEMFPVKYVTKEETVTFKAYNLYPKFPAVYPECGDSRQVIFQYAGGVKDANE